VRVQFFNGATLLSEDTTAPYTSQWNVGAAGTYTLTARATDNAGAVTASSPATITVKKKR
jgi:chitinase